MESFDFDDYKESVKKMIQLMPKLKEHVQDLETSDLEAMVKYFRFQQILNNRMSKSINEILIHKTYSHKLNSET